LSESQATIPGGFCLLPRHQAELVRKDKPPYYAALYLHLITAARFIDSDDIRRGQVLTSLGDLQEALTYHAGRRKEAPNVNQIRRALDWLEQCGVIKHERHHERHQKSAMNNTKRTLITLINYDIYQDVKSYERHQNTAMTDSANDTNANSHIMNARVCNECITNDDNINPRHGRPDATPLTAKTKSGRVTPEDIEAMIRGDIPLPEQAERYHFDPVYRVAERLCEIFTDITGRKTHKGEINHVFDILHEHGYSPKEVLHVIRLESTNPYYQKEPASLTVQHALKREHMQRRVQTPLDHYENKTNTTLAEMETLS